MQWFRTESFWQEKHSNHDRSQTPASDLVQRIAITSTAIYCDFYLQQLQPQLIAIFELFI